MRLGLGKNKPKKSVGFYSNFQQTAPYYLLKHLSLEGRAMFDDESVQFHRRIYFVPVLMLMFAIGLYLMASFEPSMTGACQDVNSFNPQMDVNSAEFIKCKSENR